MPLRLGLSPANPSTAARIADEDLRRLERMLPPLFAALFAFIVVTAEHPLRAAPFILAYFVANPVISWMQRRHRRTPTGATELGRYVLNSALFGVVAVLAGPSSPAWMLLVPGIVRAPLALPNHLAALAGVLYVGLAVGAGLALSAPVADVATAALVLVYFAAVAFAIGSIAGASQRKAFASLLETLPTTVLLCDADGLVLAMNRPIPPRRVEDVIGHHYLEFTPLEARARVTEIVRRVLETGTSAAYDIYLPEPSWWLEVHVAPNPGSASERGIVFVIVDVTERKRLEEGLDRARAEAEALSNAKSDFLSVVSHELRTPVDALLSGLALLERNDRSVDSESAVVIESMTRAGQQLRGQVDDLLDMSRFVHRQQALRTAPTDLVGTVRATVAMFALSRKPGIELRIDVPPDFPRALLGDGERWASVLRNLVSNALKNTVDGSVRVALAAYDAEGGIVRCTVTDTGRGIAKEHLDRVFEPFFQVDDARRGSGGGVGLGLALCRESVALMGGTLAVRSEEGEGTRFEFTARMPRIEKPCEPKSERPSPVVTSAFEGRSVLLVEDNAVNAMLLRRLLERDRAKRVEVASEGRAALALATDSDFEVVLLDVHLPDMLGTEVAHELRTRGFSGPIVAITADTTEAMQRSITEAGIDAISPKPVDLAELRRTVAARMVGLGTEPPLAP